MRRAQGKPRALPDGYLHLQNYSVTKASGMAGALFNYVMTERHKEIVEAALLELAQKQDLTVNPRPVAIFKHDCWRFDKEFLATIFKPIVYGTYKLIRRNASEQMAIAINREFLQTESAKVRWP
ncbi:hypothetical protein [Pseudomonas guariconensis]|uniref:hypothetical protein n=1 Tax=Pseudomonas guariconensis TaxID=1288410 RepID=UPI002B051F21|nr:hypothetical protein [Pseudomonas guariconensis]